MAVNVLVHFSSRAPDMYNLFIVYYYYLLVVVLVVVVFKDSKGQRSLSVSCSILFTETCRTCKSCHGKVRDVLID